jgi:GT2 family glycosyltransferase
MTDAANAPMVSVVTVTFNSEKFIRGCCASVVQNAGPTTIEHVVIDNGSTDATVGIVRTEFPRVRLVENRMNLGFTAANNQGASLSGGRYVVLRIPDDGRADGPRAHHRRACPAARRPKRPPE